MSLLKKLVTGIVGAIAGMVLAIPAPATAGPLADCAANLSTRPVYWTVSCSAPRTVTVRMERWWHWMGSSVINLSTVDRSRLVEPGTPWRDGFSFVPEQVTLQVCLTAYQDTNTPITPRICTAGAITR